MCRSATAVVPRHDIMETVDLATLRRKTSSGQWTIRWTGSNDGVRLVVLVADQGARTETYYVELPALSSVLPRYTVERFVERDVESGSTVDYCYPDSSELAPLRRGAVLGVNLGTKCISGPCAQYSKSEGCTASYDIETDASKARKGGFDLVDVPILSIAMLCSCGHSYYTSKTEERGSAAMTAGFISEVKEHRPMWLIGWNNYVFDNECLRYHCPSHLLEVFLVIRVGTFGRSSYGSIINLVGCYNVDALVYIAKSPQYALASHKLGDVAKAAGVRQKTAMPVMSGDTDPQRLMEYNMNDCVVTYELWSHYRLGAIIPALAACMCSHVYDCCRYVTGSLATSIYSSFSLSQGVVTAWSRCSKPQEYTGGYVMEPVRGIHSSVFVCDFKSMYPIIVATCGISPHDMEVSQLDDDHRGGEVNPSFSSIQVHLGSSVVTFRRDSKAIIPTLMRYLVDTRADVRKSMPDYAGALKISTNSLYGSIGYKESPLYSPLPAWAITTIGQHCIKVSRDIFEANMLTVVYGDTDSCMVTAPGSRQEVEAKVAEALNDIHEYMRSCCLGMMRMEMEAYYPRGIMLKKKRYCLIDEAGRISYKGVSAARSDASPIVKSVAREAARSLLTEDLSTAVAMIADHVQAIVYMHGTASLTVRDVSRYVKRNEGRGYEYVSSDEKPNFVMEGSSQLDSPARCSLKALMSDVKAEVERFTVPCGVGRMHTVMESATCFW